MLDLVYFCEIKNRIADDIVPKRYTLVFQLKNYLYTSQKELFLGQTFFVSFYVLLKW